MKKKYVCIDIETNEIFTEFPHDLIKDLKAILESDRKANKRLLDEQNIKISQLTETLKTLQTNLAKTTSVVYKITK